MGSSADRAAALVQAIEATVSGDSRVVGELYADDVQGWSPTMTVTSAAQLAVELEDRQDAFSDIELDVTPLDVGDDQACVEWIATRDPLRSPGGRRRSRDRTLRRTIHTARSDGRGLRG